MPDNASDILKEAEKLPESERRKIEKHGQPGAGKSLGGLATGGGTGFGLFWILNKLGLFSALDLTDPNELAGVTAVLTVVSAWLGRILNELRKDHPEKMRKIGLGSVTSFAVFTMFLVGCTAKTQDEAERRREFYVQACKSQCPIVHLAAINACQRIDEDEEESLTRDICIAEARMAADACPYGCEQIQVEVDPET